MQVSVNLLSEGNDFFDLLKAAIREWQTSGWEHERRRAEFALNLYERALTSYRLYLEELQKKSKTGLNILPEQLMLTKMEKELAYWEKKREELIKQKTVSSQT